jgi:PAS domain S-box-containing protein
MDTLQLTRNGEMLVNLLLEKSIDGIFIIDADFRIIEWNRAMTNISGERKEDIIDKSLFVSFPFFDAIEEIKFIRKALGGEESLSTDRPYYFLSNNKKGFFEAHYTPLTNVANQVTGVLAIFRDITQLRTFDDQLINLTDKLRETIGQKTRELLDTNDKLKKQLRDRKMFGYDILLKNIELTDSIAYARHIQEAILPLKKEIEIAFPQSFVFFRPKEIVSGDFYWYNTKGNKHYMAAVDCTGHGVPGALISILGYNSLNQAINEHGMVHPSDILNYLNKSVGSVFNHSERSTVRDGMDISLCCVDYTTMTLEYAGAFNPLYYFSKGVFKKIKGNRFPIGSFQGEELKEFVNHEINIKPGDVFYIFTDGFADQFGGPREKKFKQRQFVELLLENFDTPMHNQENLLRKTILDWQGNNEQVDDMLVIGFRI